MNYTLSKNNGFIKYNDGIKSTSSYWYCCNTYEELDILLNNLNTKVYKFLIRNIRSGMAIVSTINALPILKDKKYNDLELKEFFNFTDSEFELIK